MGKKGEFDFFLDTFQYKNEWKSGTKEKITSVIIIQGNDSAAIRLVYDSKQCKTEHSAGRAHHAELDVDNVKVLRNPVKEKVLKKILDLSLNLPSVLADFEWDGDDEILWTVYWQRCIDFKILERSDFTSAFLKKFNLRKAQGPSPIAIAQELKNAEEQVAERAAKLEEKSLTSNLTDRIKAVVKPSPPSAHKETDQKTRDRARSRSSTRSVHGNSEPKPKAESSKRHKSKKEGKKPVPQA